MGAYIPQLYQSDPTTQARFQRLVFTLSKITKRDLQKQELGTMPSTLRSLRPGPAGLTSWSGRRAESPGGEPWCGNREVWLFPLSIIF